MADLRQAISRRRAAELTVDPLVDTIDEFAGAIADAVDKRYNLSNSRAENFLKKYMTERVGMVNDTTRKALQKALEEDDPRAAVAEVFRKAREVRARQIADTEVVRTSNWAAIDAGKWVEVLAFKRWATQQDGVVRETHSAMHGQLVGWAEDFTSPSGARGPVPGALGTADEDINCRCAAVPTREGIVADMTSEGESAVELYDRLREPMIQNLESAWRQVFDEQEAAVLAELD